MPAFKFRLEKVLDMRRQQEQQLQRRHADLRALAEDERQKWTALQVCQQEKRADLAARQRGHLEINEVMNYLAYLEWLTARLVEQAARVAQADRQVEAARQDLLRASQERKAVEKLRDKQYDAHRKEAQRVEMGALDEMSAARFNRSRSADPDGRRAAPGEPPPG